MCPFGSRGKSSRFDERNWYLPRWLSWLGRASRSAGAPDGSDARRQSAPDPAGAGAL